MKRKMLIIANPGELDAENYCEGVNQDVTRYHRFFTSIQGGAWKPDEIKTLIRPEPREVDLALSELKSADYSMVIFCGHGYSRKNGTTMVELYKDCDYDSNNFKQGAARHTVILDCCRVVYEPVSESVSNHYELRASADIISPLCNTRETCLMMLSSGVHPVLPFYMLAARGKPPGITRRPAVSTVMRSALRHFN